MTAANWDGAFNLADLGGNGIRGGGTTVPGVFYRSGRPEWLTTEGWRQARGAGLTTIVDLRNAHEMPREQHHPVIDDDAMSGITVNRLPTEDPDDEEFMRVCGPWLDHPRSYADNLAFYPQKFARIFRAIAEAEGAVLFHCSGGRDRTGMIAAVLLRLADATPEAIADDYERGVRAAHEHVRQNPDHAGEPVRSDAELELRIAERREALVTWIEAADVRGYLTAAGVAGEHLNVLASRLRGEPKAAQSGTIGQ